MAVTSDMVVRIVQESLDEVIPADFERGARTWRRERDRVSQTIRLERMRNAAGHPWVVLSVFLDVHPSGRDRRHGLVPVFREQRATRGRDDGFGFNFRFDDTDELVADKARHLRDEMPLCLSYLDRTSTQDGYLATMPEGYYLRKLEAFIDFGRSADVAECLERMALPEIDDWSYHLELLECVLLGYELLDARPADRWLDLVDRTLAKTRTRLSKPNAARHGRVVELREQAVTR